MSAAVAAAMGPPSLYTYATRIIPILSVLAISILLVFSFIVAPFGHGQPGAHTGAATPWQLVLSLYTMLLHIGSIVFPARVCYAMGDVIRKTKETAMIRDNPKRRRSRTIETPDRGSVSFPVPLFVIILPAYKEEMDTLEETLRVLASHPQARHCYHIYLAMEEREEKAPIKAISLISTFERAFYRMSYTIHPSNIPGEAQGKSSNENWAAKQASCDYPDEIIKQNVIITTMDADTHLSPRYFHQVARLHLDHPETSDTTIYVPPLVFDRNLHHVPLPVRTADVMWAGAGISSLYEGSEVCIPTSVYSMPMTLVERVGGWDTDPGSIGEDMHMYLKCFFALSGNLDVKIVYAAASQCNVSSDAKGIKGYAAGLEARYGQALRHMWGSLDTGFAIRQVVEMVHRHRLAGQAKVDLPISAPSPEWSTYYTRTGMPSDLSIKPPTSPPIPTYRRYNTPNKPIHKWNTITLFQRLFEAHFLPIHLCVILTTSAIYDLFYPIFLKPSLLKVALDFSGWCRLAGFCMMLLFFRRYENYHKLCVGLRKEEMRRAGLLEEMEARDGFSEKVFLVAGLAEAALFPLGGFVFGAIPALQAVMSHVVTDRLTYVVSLKPQFLTAAMRGKAGGAGGMSTP